LFVGFFTQIWSWKKKRGRNVVDTAWKKKQGHAHLDATGVLLLEPEANGQGADATAGEGI